MAILGLQHQNGNARFETLHIQYRSQRRQHGEAGKGAAVRSRVGTKGREQKNRLRLASLPFREIGYVSSFVGLIVLASYKVSARSCCFFINEKRVLDMNQAKT